jgi:outer membrane receptor for ferrienterochelin and colicins
VSSDRQWLTDRNTGKDISNNQFGVYAQTTTPVMPWLDVVLAGRLDDPSQYDRQWSPKAGVVVKPITDQAFRVTFNRAFKSPTILQTNFFIPDWTSGIAIFGNTGGFTTQRANGSTAAVYKPMVPETNKTWEYGYKGVFRDRLFVDATYYQSDYKNFMSPLTVIGIPAAGTFAVPTVNPGNTIPVNSQGRVVNHLGVTPITLIYYNLGDAEVWGTDLGANFVATRHIDVRATLSTVKIDTLIVPPGAGAGGVEATSLNSPTTKWTVGASAKDVGPWSASLTWRNVNAYYFRSGSNTGVVPTFGTVDASVSLKLPQLQNALLSLGVSNLFSCTAQDVRYSTPPVTAPAVSMPNSVIASEDRKCGLNRKHIEMINMPEIGTMAFLGVRFSR